jgi:hypothetical protein
MFFLKKRLYTKIALKIIFLKKQSLMIFVDKGLSGFSVKFSDLEGRPRELNNPEHTNINNK